MQDISRYTQICPDTPDMCRNAQIMLIRQDIPDINRYAQMCAPDTCSYAQICPDMPDACRYAQICKI
jgi:hypothetical protein